ncbi:MAG: hypothetical protein M3Z04_12495 [Chloroflexota bacterium]|nr:hypothetical protein [Chloroflexota bacterium]
MISQVIVDQLLATPRNIATVQLPVTEGGIPNSAGLYAWWVQHGALTGVPANPHPTEPGWDLLYIGIAPKDPGSPATMRKRVRTQHLGGDTASSTFRLSLAALLMDTMGWQPVQRSSQAKLLPADNARLSAWQRQHLGLTWATVADPWAVEAEIIAALQPPLNLKHNTTHPFYTRYRRRTVALQGGG